MERLRPVFVDTGVDIPVSMADAAGEVVLMGDAVGTSVIVTVHVEVSVAVASGWLPVDTEVPDPTPDDEEPEDPPMSPWNHSFPR